MRAALLALLVVLVTVGCSSNAKTSAPAATRSGDTAGTQKPTPPTVVGRWQVIEPKETNLSMEFTGDGKYTFGSASEPILAGWSYAIEGDRLTLTESHDGTAFVKNGKIVKLSADELELELQGVSEDGKLKMYGYKLKRIGK